jgi:hypothetical protein
MLKNSNLLEVLLQATHMRYPRLPNWSKRSCGSLDYAIGHRLRSA